MFTPLWRPSYVWIVQIVSALGLLRGFGLHMHALPFCMRRRSRCGIFLNSRHAVLARIYAQHKASALCGAAARRHAAVVAVSGYGRDAFGVAPALALRKTSEGRQRRAGKCFADGTRRGGLCLARLPIHHV
ncbi:hypothetical protein HPB50_017211 [Hyalomma asiaticum]|uniref:Uncharacterized protein n=1 Tax=Hyalomma asiaticum TaxID=266040 RepID=A0ACB7SA88_HYAAI|nr:hypothetical protein HPB50_017211 [Hyalomma asiaticum]